MSRTLTESDKNEILRRCEERDQSVAYDSLSFHGAQRLRACLSKAVSRCLPVSNTKILQLLDEKSPTIVQEIPESAAGTDRAGILYYVPQYSYIMLPAWDFVRRYTKSGRRVQETTVPRHLRRYTSWSVVWTYG